MQSRRMVGLGEPSSSIEVRPSQVKSLFGFAQKINVIEILRTGRAFVISHCKVRT